MAAGEGILAYGMQFFYSDDSTTYTELEDIDDLGPPGDLESPDVDVTPLNPADAVRVFRTGLAKGGNFPFSQFYSASRYSTLRAIRAAGVDYWWKVRLPDGTTPTSGSTIVVQGPLKKCTLKATGDPDDPLCIECSITVNSDQDFTEAT